jgi:hypothetical protein
MARESCERSNRSGVASTPPETWPLSARPPPLAGELLSVAALAGEVVVANDHLTQSTARALNADPGFT